MLLFPAPEPSASLSSLVIPLELAEANDTLVVALRRKILIRFFGSYLTSV
jgi:hypothetical protein